MDERTYKRIVTKVRRHCGIAEADVGRAEDAVQDAYVRMLEREATGEVIKDVPSLLTLTAIRLYINRVKRECHPAHGQVSFNELHNSPHHGDPARGPVGEPVEVKMWVEGFTQREIAEARGVSQMTVWKRLERWRNEAR